MDYEGETIRKLIQNGDPETLRTGLKSLGWPDDVANEQAQSMRLGLSGIDAQMANMARRYPRESPGNYETMFANPKNAKKPSPRQLLREQYNKRTNR